MAFILTNLELLGAASAALFAALMGLVIHRSGRKKERRILREKEIEGVQERINDRIKINRSHDGSDPTDGLHKWTRD